MITSCFNLILPSSNYLLVGSCDISFEVIYSTELGGNLVVPTLGSAVDCLDVARLGGCALSKENADFQKYFRFY